MAFWPLIYFGKKAYDDLRDHPYSVPLPGKVEYDGVWSNWMQQLQKEVSSSLLLKDICLPGSHDAGMHKAENQTPFGTVSVTRTQWFPISDQLHLGVRVFDLRPVWSQNNFYTGHYTEIPSGPLNALKEVSDTFKGLGSSDVNADKNWQGANGELFDDIINAVNEFLGKHSELVVLDLSDNNWFDVTRRFNKFNAEQLDKFYAKLRSIKNLWTAPAKGVRLSDIKLNEFIGKGGACICIVPPHAEDYSDWKKVDECGFFKTWHWYPEGKSKSDTWWSLSKQMSDADYVANVIKDRMGSVLPDLPNPGDIFRQALGGGGTVNGLPDSVLKRALFKNSGDLPTLSWSKLTNVMIPDSGEAKDETRKIRVKYQVAQADAITDVELAHQCLWATMFASGVMNAEIEKMKKGAAALGAVGVRVS